MIKDVEKLFDFLKNYLKISYIIVPNYYKFNRADLKYDLIEHVQKNCKRIKFFKGNDLITARDLIEKIYLGKKSELENISRIGPSYEIYEIR